MNQTIGHKVLDSVKEYFNYRLIEDLAAYKNKTVNLYEYTDTEYSDLAVYGSPYAQWVYQSAQGITVPSGVTSTGFISRGTNGLAIDFINGRALMSGTQTGLSLTANVSVAEINTYLTTFSDSRIISETNSLTKPIYSPANSYIKPNSNIAPALFFRNSNTENLPYSFGGHDWTYYKIRIFAMMKNNSQLTAVGDMIRDSKNRIFPILEQSALNEYNDLKSGWNYYDELNDPSSYACIERANFTYVQNDLFSQKNPNMEVGIGTLDIKMVRRPHE